VLCTGAVRDEGVSHHYLPTDTPVGPDRGLTEALGEALAERGPLRSGMTWTIDAPYRETVAEVRRYRAEGVLTVEMEAAALFAVAAVRSVPMASAFCISDLLSSVTWDPRFDAPELHDGLAALADTAIEVLATFPFGAGDQ
jgi:uridine phosphorylase